MFSKQSTWAAGLWGMGSTRGVEVLKESKPFPPGCVTAQNPACVSSPIPILFMALLFSLNRVEKIMWISCKSSKFCFPSTKSAFIICIREN